MTPVYKGQEFNGKQCKKMINNLVKICATMISNITKLGTNDPDPYNYIDWAIRKNSFVKTIHKFVAYYFFISCRERNGVDQCLNRYLNKDIKCDSNDSLVLNTDSSKLKYSTKDSGVRCHYLLVFFQPRNTLELMFRMVRRPHHQLPQIP